MILIEDFVDGMEKELREVFFSSIRTACVNDYNNAQLEAWAPEAYNKLEWSERIKGIRPFVARLEGKIVGYSDLQQDGYINHFFVHGQYQGRGVGTALMSTIFNRSAELETLHSQVSISAKPFFMRHGFKVINTQQIQIRNVNFINYSMQYRIKT